MHEATTSNNVTCFCLCRRYRFSPVQTAFYSPTISCPTCALRNGGNPTDWSQMGATSCSDCKSNCQGASFGCSMFIWQGGAVAFTSNVSACGECCLCVRAQSWGARHRVVR